MRNLYTEKQVDRYVRKYVVNYNEGNWSQANEAYADLCEAVEQAEEESVSRYAEEQLDELDRDGYLQDY